MIAWTVMALTFAFAVLALVNVLVFQKLRLTKRELRMQLARQRESLESALREETVRQERAESALKESEGRFRTITEWLPHLVWTCNPDGWCDYLSRQWVVYTGRSEQEQQGFGWADALHPDDRDRVRAAWTRATESGDPFDVEFRIRRHDGVYRWFKTRALPLRDASGAIVKWYGSNTDFDDLKRMESKLQVQVERLALLDGTTRAIGRRQDLESIFGVVLSALEESLAVELACVGTLDDATGLLRIVAVGPRGQAVAERLGLSQHDAIPVDSNGLRRCVGGELVHETNLGDIPFDFPRRLAAAGVGALVAAPLAIETKVFGVLLVARKHEDFSSSECEFLRQLSEHVALAAHQAQMYDALQRAYDDLRRSQQTAIQQERLRALGQMASGIAHDINNALSPVAVYADMLLEREPLSDQAREFMQTIQRAIGDAAQTVARMSEFYRQREPELVLKPVNLNELVPQVLNLTRARWSDMAQQRGIEIITRSDLCADLPSIDGVESEIREALVNLIFNAVDAMPEGGMLSVRTGTQRVRVGTHETRRVYVEVQDTGVGMDERTRERCLEPFFTTKGDRGTGLGLSMVFGTARRHEAEVEIDSAPRQGARVRVTFPSATRAQSAQPRDEPERIAPLRILLVDDDTLILRSLQTMLEGDGHQVVAAPGGEDGIRVWNEQASGFDLVITDLGMPRTDGRRVAAAVKERQPTTPVVMLTGWGRGLVGDSIPPHVDRVLSKPPKLLEVRAALAELTELEANALRATLRA